MNELLFDLVVNAVWALLGAIGLRIFYLANVTIPYRKLWQLGDSTSLVICTAASTFTDTGKYLRPATGIGNIQALALAVTSLNNAYGKLTIKNILFATDQLQERLENDLLILGGPKTNPVAARFLELVRTQQPAVFVGSKLVWRIRIDNLWSDQGATEYSGEYGVGRVFRDYGLIMRVQSPFTSQNRTVVLLCGVHTFGTIAAARYFTERLCKKLPRFTKPGRNVVAVVSAQVVDGYPTSIRLEEYYQW